MKYQYPFRFPLARLFSLLGVPIIIKVELRLDPEAEVYIATSKDIPGLVIESDTLIDLKNQVEEAIPNLLSLEDNKTPYKTSAGVVFKDHIAVA